MRRYYQNLPILKSKANRDRKKKKNQKAEYPSRKGVASIMGIPGGGGEKGPEEVLKTITTGQARHRTPGSSENN